MMLYNTMQVQHNTIQYNTGMMIKTSCKLNIRDDNGYYDGAQGLHDGSQQASLVPPPPPPTPYFLLFQNDRYYESVAKRLRDGGCEG